MENASEDRKLSVGGTSSKNNIPDGRGLDCGVELGAWPVSLGGSLWPQKDRQRIGQEDCGKKPSQDSFPQVTGSQKFN